MARLRSYASIWSNDRLLVTQSSRSQQITCIPVLFSVFAGPLLLGVKEKSTEHLEKFDFLP